MPSFQIQCLPVGRAFETNCFLVKNPSAKELFLVDPGGEAEKIMEAVGDFRPVAALLTHGHYDHMGAADEICAHYGIPLYVHAEDVPKLTDPEANGSALFASPMTVETKPLPLEEGQRLSLAGLSVTVLHTPGHSRGSCCFLLPEGEGLLCGDTLFDGGYGRTDIADGNFGDMKKSLRRLLFVLPPMTAYPGHGPFAKAGQKRETAL